MNFHGGHGGHGHGGHRHGDHRRGWGGFIPYAYVVECDPSDPRYLDCLDRFGCDAAEVLRDLEKS